jgi:hypothetical protein|tara:strand:- start:228 stop:1952 length:1725 start_codon:yes stop_codon:yes gene_type:complete
MGKTLLKKVKKDSTLNYGMLHYHCRPGGVRTVMENSAYSLFRYGGFNKINMSFIGDILTHKKWVGTFDIPGHNIVNIDINELNYSFKKHKSKIGLLKDAKKLKDKIIDAIPLKECTFDKPYYLHTHNINLGKNPVVSIAMYLLAEWAINKPIVIIIQIHDFAENGRYGLLKNMQTCTGKFDKEFASKMMYPNQKSVIYAVINPGDRKNLIDIGIDEERVFLLPNSIDTSHFQQKPLDDMSIKELQKIGLKKKNFSNEIKTRIKKFSDNKNFKFDRNKKIILAPLKCMRRKNIMESILLLELLGKKYQLLVSLDAGSGDDKKYSTKVKKFVKKNNLNVVIGVGEKIVAPVAKRVIEDGKVQYFNMDDLFEISEAVITTSLVEGFGFVYHEGWLTNKFVFGRKIPYVTEAYEKNDMDFNHMYIKFNINPSWINMKRIKRKYFEKINLLKRKQGYKPLNYNSFEVEFKEKKIKDGFIDFGSLDVVAQVLFLLKINKYREDLLDINPPLKKLKIKNSIIKQNKKMSEKNYDLKAKSIRLNNLFKEGKRLIKVNTKNKKVDNTKLIDKYLDLENVNLLV